MNGRSRIVFGALFVSFVSACDSSTQAPPEKPPVDQVETIAPPVERPVISSLPSTPKASDWITGGGATITPNADGSWAISFGETPAKGFVYVRAETDQDLSYTWSGLIRNAGQDDAQTAAGIFDGEFQRQSLTAEAEWTEFSLSSSPQSKVTHYYIDNRIDASTATDVEIKDVSLSVTEAQEE